jgi:hypothetical protein
VIAACATAICYALFLPGKKECVPGINDQRLSTESTPHLDVRSGPEKCLQIGSGTEHLSFPRVQMMSQSIDKPSVGLLTLRTSVRQLITNASIDITTTRIDQRASRAARTLIVA